MEIRLRDVSSLQYNYSKLVRFQISWERDHLVSSGADPDGKFATGRSTSQGVVRTAERRQLDEQGLELTVKIIQRKAAGDDRGKDERVWAVAG